LLYEKKQKTGAPWNTKDTNNKKGEVKQKKRAHKRHSKRDGPWDGYGKELLDGTCDMPEKSRSLPASDKKRLWQKPGKEGSERTTRGRG